MASRKPQTLSSAASCEKLSEVQVLDSCDPLASPSTSVASRSLLSEVQVLNSYEPLVTASTSTLSKECNEVVEVMDSSEPLVTASYTSETTSSVPGDQASSGVSRKRVHIFSKEFRSMWNWRKIFTKLGTNEQCVQFAEERGIIPKTMQCKYHKRPMVLSAPVGQLGKFRCRKSNCRTKDVSRAKGTWFENVRLSLTLSFQIMYAFSEGLTYHQTQKQLSQDNEPVISTKTIADWYRYCRETITLHHLEQEDSRPKIGGPNKIVQIHESKFGRRTYNRGRHIEGHWVIGMIEDGSEDLRLEVCPNNNRSADILVPLIKKHVQEGTIIHTNCWESYDSLPEHGYIHKKAYHSDLTNKFVAPDGTRTQRRKSQWRGLIKKFRQEQNKTDFTDWLIEYSWRHKIMVDHLDPFEELLKSINYVYKIRLKGMFLRPAFVNADG